MLLGLLLAPRMLWERQPWRDLKVLIIDKSVPDTSYREHMALIWVLNHLKITAPDGAPIWDPARHYLGFHPPVEDPALYPLVRDQRITPEALKGNALVCLTDSYGVYQQDLQIARPENTASPDYSPRLTGGLDAAEVTALQHYVQAGGALWGEFNTFASPTAAAERQALEQLFGVRWTGWTGRYFDELAQEQEIPAWARRLWQAQRGQAWAFEGPGWLLVHEDNRLQVLREGQEIVPQGLKIRHDQSHPLLQQAQDSVPFYYWFDILTADPSAQVLAEYEMTLLPPGQTIFEQAGLPQRFPALIMASASPLRLYFAGDASDLAPAPERFRLAGLGPWHRFGRRYDSQTEQRAFFWSFYQPLWVNILAQLKPLP
ncbi:MAG: hypothetical protein IGS03_17490 [Candidatus Sericytochromatia bacterium]|nr:hypothetical protein [Candidatus Sericytochromatia bacterium]